MHSLVIEATRTSSANEKKKPISFEKLLPYVTKTLDFLVDRILVRGELPTYKEVSSAIGAGSPQNANRAFGAIHRILEGLSLESKFSGDQEPPDITTIVRNTGKSSSGTGVYHHPNMDQESKNVKEAWLHKERRRVWSYPHWPEILAFLELRPLEDLLPSSQRLNEFEKASRGMLGKSLEHQALQDIIENRPLLVGIDAEKLVIKSCQEYQLWSLDRMDILFVLANEWIGVEVKPSFAIADEIRKGIFQVIKYRSLLAATLLAEGKPFVANCILALGGTLPVELRALTERLDVQVIEMLKKHLDISAMQR